MTFPPFLKHGDTVCIVSPSGCINPDKIKDAKEELTSWGLNVVTGKNAFAKFNNFAGSDICRTADFQEALDNPRINAILCSRGGYGAIRIIDKLNWKKFAGSPKWIIGYSDITVFHTYINNVLKIATVHGPMAICFTKLGKESESIGFLRKLIFGEEFIYRFNNTFKLKPCTMDGRIAGGNLSVLFSLSGTGYDNIEHNSILFLEDTGEHYYNIDRMINGLRLQKKLNGLNAVVLGSFSDLKDNDIPFGNTVDEIVKIAVNNDEIKIISGFPAGHDSKNYPFISGGRIRISVSGNETAITQCQRS